MKEKIFTLFLFVLIGGSMSLYAQVLNTGTGVEWGTLGASEPLVLDEDFQGFEFFHSDEMPNDGNSSHSIDPISNDTIFGYKNDTVEAAILGSCCTTVKYYYYQCAFAPEWKTAYAFRDSTDNTTNVSDGFVEISRDYPYGAEPFTVHGWFVVDLRAIDFVEVIQWSHSSTGGNKRGVMCEFSLDDGANWDTLRYQPGNTWALSFTKDPTTGVKTSNGYRCDPSAYGMTWEDGIYTSNVMLRFAEAGGQTPRIHDLKVYGTFVRPTSSKEIDVEELNIYSFNKEINISEPAKVAVYNLSGSLVKSADEATTISMDDMPDGIYLVKAQAGNKLKTSKVLIK